MTFCSGCTKQLAVLPLLIIVLIPREAEPSTTLKPPVDCLSGDGGDVVYAEVKSSENPRVRVTISEKTTYITVPLRGDGYPDYAAALNHRFSRGVTPKNNAAVVFWKVIGPNSISKNRRKELFQMLGILPLSEEGNYLLDISDYANRLGDVEMLASHEVLEKRRAEIQEHLNLWRHPWSKREFPMVAGWLAANEKPLALLVEGFNRPRWYTPIIWKDSNENEETVRFGNNVKLIQAQRYIARVLAARAMLRLQEGNVDAAWEDLLACRRLARLVRQEPTILSAAAATSIDHIVCAVDRTFLQHAQLTAVQAAKMRDDLAKLPLMPSVADTIDIGERFEYLNQIVAAARDGPISLEKVSIDERDNTVKSVIGPLSSLDINWDVVLRVSNSWFDRLADALRKPTHTERKKAVDKIADDINKIRGRFQVDRASGTGSYAESLQGKPRDVVSNAIGEALVSLLLCPFSSLLVDTLDHAMMQTDLTKLGFALAAYHFDNGLYPVKLADLVPKYILKIPKDIFNDKDLHYKREGHGYLLYSVGIDGKDDGGKNYFNPEKGRNWDDLVVSMPSDEKQ